MEDMLKKAEKISREAHKGQTRWGGEPYITHPEAVANSDSLKNYFGCQIVAWLHDVLEDTDVKVQDLIDAGFDKGLIGAIVNLTRLGKESYLDYILRVKRDEIARKVKIEDLKHNLSDLKKGSMKDKYILALYILEECKK